MVQGLFSPLDPICSLAMVTDPPTDSAIQDVALSILRYARHRLFGLSLRDVQTGYGWLPSATMVMKETDTGWRLSRARNHTFKPSYIVIRIPVHRSIPFLLVECDETECVVGGF